MEKHKRSCGRQGRKKVEVNMRNNTGGIEGVVMLGGALAIASLVAAFTIKKGNRNHTKNSAAIDSCRKEDGTQGLCSTLHQSSSTLHQISCCTKHGTSEIGVSQIKTCELVSPQSLISLEGNIMRCEREIVIHDTEQESTAKTGDIEEISRPVLSDPKPMDVVEEKSGIEPLVMETIDIEIEGEAADADTDAEQPFEEISTLQSSSSSVDEEKSSSSSSFTTGEEDEEEYSPMRSAFSTEEEEEEEEYSPMRSLFSTEEDEDEENSPTESSFSTEEDEEEEEESPLQTPFSIEEDESGESVTEMEEESSEGTWSSSTESNYMKAMPPESKEINISHQTSVKKPDEIKGSTANGEDYLAAAFEKNGNKDGQSKKETQELVVINDQKPHSAKPQIWVRLGLVLLLLLLLLANILLLPLNYLFDSAASIFPTN